MCDFLLLLVVVAFAPAAVAVFVVSCYCFWSSPLLVFIAVVVDCFVVYCCWLFVVLFFLFGY